MQNKKSILASALVTGALLTGAGLYSASAFGFNNLGNGENIRTNLSANGNIIKNLEHTCGQKSKSDSTKTKDAKKTKNKKGNDHKCGKDGKCGEGKCGGK